MKKFHIFLYFFLGISLYLTSIIFPLIADADLSNEYFASGTGFCPEWVNINNSLGLPDGNYASLNNKHPLCGWKFPSINIPQNSVVNKITTKIYNSSTGNYGFPSMSPAYISQSCIPPPFWPATLYNGLHEYVVTSQNCPTTIPTINQLNSGFIAWDFYNSYLNSSRATLQTDAISMQIDYTPPSVTPTPITDFKQTDPQWSTLPSLPSNTNTHLNHSTDCGDMYGYGCAVTATSDVLYSYGNSALSDNSTLDPGSLNNWLTVNHGLNKCYIDWSLASTAVKIGAPTKIFRNDNPDWTNGQQAIDDALINGDIPILGITTQYGTHFLAISEKLPDVNGKPDYTLVDPAQYPFVEGNPGNTGMSLSQKYGGFDKVFETVIYHKGSTPQNTLTIRGHSPMQLLITDPNGKTTGFDASSQEISENIPNSSYGIEGGIAPIDGSLPAQSEIKYFQQINPSAGKYLVKIIGTGTGGYTLDFSKTDEQGNIATQEIGGSTVNGKVEEYSFEYSPSANDPINLEPVDITPPVTNIVLYGNQGQTDWYKSDVDVVLSATDEESGSGVYKTYYSINGSAIQTYSGQFTITDERDYSIEYYSTDNAGNKENTKTKIFHIDKTPPQINLTVDKSYLWPPNRKMVPVTVTSSFSDDNLWLKVITLNDEYGEITPLLTEGVNNIALIASRKDDDMDGRYYTVTASAQDKAGNASQKQENIIVLHDQRK